MGALKGGRLILAIVVALIAIALVWFVVDRLFLAPDRAAKAAAVAKIDKGAAEVQLGNAKGAIAAGEEKAGRDRIIERTTRENTIRILAAPGSDQLVPNAVFDEFLASLCLRREATRADPACAGVPGPREGQPEQGDPVGANPN